MLSRSRRVQDVVQRLERAEAALTQANDALTALRELVEQGASKVAP